MIRCKKNKVSTTNRDSSTYIELNACNELVKQNILIISERMSLTWSKIAQFITRESTSSFVRCVIKNFVP